MKIKDAKTVSPRNKYEREIAARIDVKYWRYVDSYYADGQYLPNALRSNVFAEAEKAAAK